MSGIVGKNLGRGSGVVTATPVGADVVSGANLADDACNSEHYTDGSVDLVHLQTGTDGQIISWDASGDPVAVGPGTDGQVLTSAGAGAPPVFEDAAGGGEDGLTNNSNTTWMVVSSDEEVTMPLQPCFAVYPNAQINNVTGDSALYEVVWNTEIFDQNADFATPNFTAPVTGRYLLLFNIAIGGMSQSWNYIETYLVTSNRTYYQEWNTNISSVAATAVSLTRSFIADMDAADTASVKFKVVDSGKTTDVKGSSSTPSWFAGCLLA